MDRKLSKRKLKHYLNHMCKQLKYGMYVIDCRAHPCRITEGARFHTQDLYGAEFACVSLVTDTPNSCSVIHCGPEPISRELAYEMADYWKKNGTHKTLIKYQGLTQEGLDNFDELDKVWNFEKPD